MRPGQLDREVGIGGGLRWWRRCTVLLAPETTAALCRTGALSSEGRCKSFSADADGYARAEGCGVLVLTRLDDAPLATACAPS